MRQRFDCIVIGSGYGGTISAARLAEGGMRVALLARGAKKTSSQLRQSDAPSDLVDIIDVVVSSENVGYRTGTLLGGASINMDGAFYRVPSFAFEHKDASGRRKWPEPYTRALLDPYYRRVEKMLSIRQRTWNEVPKGGGLFAQMLAAAGASVDLTPMNYTDCKQCGFCAQGCIFNKKITLLHSYIPFAEGLPGSPLTILTGFDARRIGKEGTDYVVYGQQDGAPVELQSERVVVAGGGLHTPALLLRSAAELTGMSDHVGRHFNFNGDHSYVGILPEDFPGIDSYDCYKGMENGGVMSFEWIESDGFTLHPGAGIEASIFASNFADAASTTLPKREFGLAYKRWAQSVYPHRIIALELMGFAESFQRVVLGKGGKPDVVSDGSRAAFDAWLVRSDAIIRGVAAKSNITIVEPYPRASAGMAAAHLMSACRMAESKEQGVVDASFRVFGEENLYVCDASVIPAAIAVNPAHTIAAFAERCAEVILETIDE